MLWILRAAVDRHLRREEREPSNAKLGSYAVRGLPVGGGACLELRRTLGDLGRRAWDAAERRVGGGVRVGRVCGLSSRRGRG